ncbi:MAG: outer membrane beta-barrel protein [Gemmatimonadaceae bacterium]
MTKRFAVLGFLALALTASAAEAQRATRPIEFGIDGGIGIFLEDPDNVTVVSIPVQSFRVGFFIDDKISIEPRLALNSLSVGDFSTRSYAVELGALYHFGGYRSGSGIYVRPFVGIEGTSGDGPSDSDGYLGAGIGVKLPFAQRRLAARLEANYAHVFDTGGSDRIGLLFGLSFFH